MSDPGPNIGTQLGAEQALNLKPGDQISMEMVFPAGHVSGFADDSVVSTTPFSQMDLIFTQSQITGLRRWLTVQTNSSNQTEMSVDRIEAQHSVVGVATVRMPVDAAAGLCIALAKQLSQFSPEMLDRLKRELLPLITGDE